MTQANFSAGELGLYALPPEGGAMALMGCYLDDSHDSLEKEVFAVGGYLGWSLGFIDAENRWKKCLDTHGLAYFHSVECENVQGEFLKLRYDPRYASLDAQKAAAAAIRNDFIDVIDQETAIDGIGLAVPLAVYRKVLETEPEARIFLQDRHFYFAYHTLMIELVKRCESTFKDHWIAFVCDDHSKRDEAEAAYTDLKEKNPKSAKKMGSMSHCDDKVVLPLQMADLVAYETRRTLLWQLQHRPVSKNDVMSRLSRSTWFIGYANEDYLRAAIQDLVGQRKEREHGG